MATHRTRPRFNRCDRCGRNPHKVAVCEADGVVRGYCPSCWTDWTGNLTDRSQTVEAARLAAGGRVLYDRRSDRA